VALTDEQFQEEMAKRRENLHLTKNDVVIGCPLCLVTPAPAGEDDRRPSAVKNPVLRIADCGLRTDRQSRIRTPQSGIRITGILFAAALICFLPAREAAAQSLTYSKGQNVAPAYEGWEQDADGTKYFLFGYMNRNWEEEIDVPVGPENGFNVGGADHGQPTHFLPRRNRFVFRVRVPADFTAKDELIWTLTTHGKTEQAFATLRPDYIVDDVVKASETGALGAGTSSPEVRSNKPPAVRIEEVKARNVKVGEWLPLVAEVKDDGIPKPRGAGFAGAAVRSTARLDAAAAAPAGSENLLRPNRATQPPSRVTVGKNVGLHLSWFVYRGPAKSPSRRSKSKCGRTRGRAPILRGHRCGWLRRCRPTAKSRCRRRSPSRAPYVLRSIADDGALTGYDELTVVVVDGGQQR
jgi:hypothetical protein